MRRQLLPFFIITAACGTDSSVPMPFDHPYPQTPEVEETEVAEAPEEIVQPAEIVIDETVDCPTPNVDNAIVEKAIAALDPSRKGRFLLWEGDYGDDDLLGAREGDVRVVFVSKGVRYTIWYTGDLFSIWERPNGTYGQEHIQTYADRGVTGCLNFGIGGATTDDDDVRRLMRWNDIGDNTGVKHHVYWQQRYQKALEALARIGR